MDAMAADKHRIFRIAVDETETLVNVHGDISHQHLLMMHGDVFGRSRHGVSAHSLCLPPAVIRDQSAETVWSAINHIVGTKLWHGSEKPPVSIVILNSDSHAALVRLAKHLATLARDGARLACRHFEMFHSLPMMRLSIHSRCQMHMFFAALGRLVRSVDALNPMFCGTVLLHKGSNMQTLRTHVRGSIAKRIAFTYDPPSIQDRLYNEYLVRLLDCADDLEYRECH
jgi:hypothetical protein